MRLQAPHFDAPADAYEQRDPELRAELKRKFAEPPPGLVESTTRSMGLDPDRLATEEGVATPPGRLVAETIVKATARPVLLIRDNSFTARFVGPDSTVWAQRIVAAGPLLDKAIPSVGRIEVKNNPDYQWVGTGWMVADDIVVTNRHVAREFARSGPGGFTFRIGLNNAPQSARIDFLEEFERNGSLEFPVESVMWIAPPEQPDVAFLRVVRAAAGPPLPPRIPLAEAVAADAFIAAIGYPARDPRVPDQDLVHQVFGDVYEKKRLAPGQIMEVTEDELEHDCSTLGGNSGSVLVSLDTGEAVGLHFSGLFLEANFAVPAPKVRDLLTKAQKGELPGMTLTPINPEPRVAPVSTGDAFTFHLQIPLEITVRVGAPATTNGGAVPALAIPASAASGSSAAASLDQAVATARQLLASVPNVLEIRPGYRFKNGRITDERVVVVEVRDKLTPTELAAASIPAIPSQILGVGVDVRTAALPDQLEAFGIDLATLEAPGKAGLYKEPTGADFKLETVKDQMSAVFHVSPDSGFPNLKAFLGRVKHHLTATIYEWEPAHISDAIQAAMAGSGKRLMMVTQPKHGIAEGTEDAVKDMRSRIGNKFKHVFASVGAGKLIPSAYHIKVACRDGEEFWLSSGNWKDSNQADIDPAGENSTKIGPLQQHNREWHAIVAHPGLTQLFQRYIEFDFSEAQRVPFEEGVMAALPEFFVPEAALMAREAPTAIKYFDPLPITNKTLEITPLLTPDRNGHHEHIFIAAAIDLVQKATSKVYVQNQSFALNEDNDEYERFFTVLRDKQQAGLDVRIIFRDTREYPHGEEGLQKILEKVKDFQFDMDQVKWQRKCHTKGIVADGSAVLLGSQNLTTAGSLFNRDASLLVRDEKVAEYFEQVFLFDWEHLAVQEADEMIGGIRPARANEATPPGFRRVSLSELLGGD